MNWYTLLISVGFFVAIIFVHRAAKSTNDSPPRAQKSPRPGFSSQGEMLQRSAEILRQSGWVREQKIPEPDVRVEPVVDTRQQMIRLWKENCQQVDAMFFTRRKTA